MKTFDGTGVGDDVGRRCQKFSQDEGPTSAEKANHMIPILLFQFDFLTTQTQKQKQQQQQQHYWLIIFT